MKDKGARLLARMDVMLGKGGPEMWYLVFGDAVLDLLSEGKTLSAESLREHLVAKSDAYDDGGPIKKAWGETLRQLDRAARGERPPVE